MGHTDAVQHEINVKKGVAPTKLPKRRLPLKQQDIVTAEVTKMLDKGIIQESQSPWTSLVVIVKKKDGKYRFCVDYRKFNEVNMWTAICFQILKIRLTPSQERDTSAR